MQEIKTFPHLIQSSWIHICECAIVVQISQTDDFSGSRTFKYNFFLTKFFKRRAN